LEILDYLKRLWFFMSENIIRKFKYSLKETIVFDKCCVALNGRKRLIEYCKESKGNKISC